jgi:alpha-mannosidase
MKIFMSLVILFLGYFSLPVSAAILPGGLIQEYLVLGDFPFDAKDEQPLLTDFLTGEAERVPFTGQEMHGKKWQFTQWPNGAVNFKIANLGFGDHCVAYTHVFVKAPAAQSVKFLLGSDDGIAVFVNGVLVHENQANRGLQVDADVFPAQLAAGWNRILCKVSNGGGEFQLCLRILDANGQPIPQLEFSAENPAAPPESFETPAIPARFHFRHLGWHPELQMTEKGDLVASITGQLYNLGNESLPVLKIKVSAKSIRETETSIPVAPLQRVFLAPVNFAELLKNSLIDSNIQLGLDWIKGHQTEDLKVRHSDILNLALNPLVLPVRVTKTSTTTYGTAKFVLPKLLKTAPLALLLPNSSATIKVNGKKISARQSLSSDLPYSGWAAFPIKGNEKNYTLEVAYSNATAPAETDFVRLVVLLPDYFLLQNAVRLSQQFPNDFFSEKQIDYPGLFHQLEKGDWSGLSRSLNQYSDAVSQFAQALQNFNIHFVGHSHIDLAWLWPWTETVEVCRATFENALNLIENHPEFTYAQSQAQTYVWIEKYFPDLFARIKKQIAAGRWIIVSGMWTEPDSNLPGGESFVRQILFGQRYFQKKFGVTTDIAWTPDTFGYAWTLPQIYRKSGLKYFMTTKIWWNDITRPKHHLFWWEAADGTRLLTFLPESIDSHPTPDFVLDKFQAYHTNTRQPDFMMLYGHGDHGGGPTQEKLDQIEILKQTKIFPKVEFSTPQKFFGKIEASPVELPVLKDEMYLEYHRGCYTTQAATKKYNRQMECLLETAEKFASFAPIAYPKAQLDDAWQRTLFNQFHDILPGSSIAIVYQHALASYDTAKTETDAVIQQAVEAIAKNVNTTGWGTPFMIFNPLSWDRDGFMEIDLPKSLWKNNLHVSDADRWVVKSQPVGPKKLLVELTQQESTPLPAVGYRVYHIQVGKTREPKIQARATEWKLINQYFEITFDPKTGNIASLKDRQKDLEILSGPGNELQFFEDIPAQYDAWNIGYTGKEWRVDPNPKFEMLEKGPLRAKIRITRTFGKSIFKQEIAVYRNQRLIEFYNEVDWHEAHVLVKAAFPVTVANDFATYEIPYGWIQRPTIPKTAADSAKFEVSAHKWIDLTDRSGNYGVSLLNDCKYGFDVKNSVMRITLLRSPKSPDPNADMGKHAFTYALFPHAGDWQTSRTIQKAHELNYPCRVYFPGSHAGTQPNSQSFVNLSENPGVLLTAYKKAEDRDAFILRLVEYYGQTGPLKINFSQSIFGAREVDLMENLGQPVTFQDKILTLEMKPFEIKSVEIRFK